MAIIPRSSFRYRALRMACAIFGVLWLTACGSTPAVQMTRLAPEAEESFDMAMNVPEDALDDMRGGFGGPSGLLIGFGLTTSTLVDGAIVSNFSISTNNLSTLTPQNLQQLVQVGSNNSFAGATPTTLGNNVVTLIQNNVNNVTIQNSNVLNVSVRNLTGLRTNAAFNNSLGALVRSLH